MIEQSEKETERYAARRSICELLLGVFMLILLAGINLYTDERPLLLHPASQANGTLVYENFKMAGSSGYCVVLDAGHGGCR